MNRAYRLVWSRANNAWVVASEITKGRGKSSSKSLLAAALMLAVPHAFASPIGGQVVSGIGTINQAGSVTTITQGSQNLSVNWKSFNIGSNETVNFLQPSASAIAVNRIFDVNGSQIFGHLNANGQVWLLNPNGILFGKSAQVNVGGLVASTLDSIQQNGNSVSFSGKGKGKIVNEGAINGNYVALIGNTVSNTGTISANQGTAALGAGSSVTLTFNGSDGVHMQVDKGVLNALVSNGGVIQADGGYLIMSAGAKDELLSSVVNTGIVSAQTVQNKAGVIKLLGGMTSGTVNVGGTLDASAPNGGNGGSIETSAANVHVSNDAKITTLASSGLTGSWLIDPQDYTIAASGGDMTGTALSNSLATSSVTIQSSSGGTSGSGNINVNDAVTWNSSQTLTLNAYNNININSNITATQGTLTLYYGQGAANSGNASRVYINNGASVSLSQGLHFNTKIGSDGVLTNWSVITALGTQTSAHDGTLQGINGTSASNETGNYVLGANIDATVTKNWNSGAGFMPIGWTGLSGFSGNFDGLGHTISNLYINRPNDSWVGFFGWCEPGSGTNQQIANFGLINANVTGGGTTAAVAGEIYSYTMSHVYASGTVYSQYGGRIGGLVGNNKYGTVIDSYSDVNVTGGSSVGGIVGSFEGTAYIINSYASGTVTGSGAGGVIGSMGSGVVTNSYYNTDVNKGSMSDSSYGKSASALTTTAASQWSSAIWDTSGSLPVLKQYIVISGQANPSQTGTAVTNVYVDPLSGSSTYGSAPVFTYNLVDSSGAIYNLSNASVNGTAAYSGAPTATSSVSSYSFSYSSGLSLSGSGASNYTLLPYATASTWTVNPKQLTVSGTQVASKVYDGTTAATLSGGILSGLVNGDTLSLAQAGNFASKNAGSNVAVTASDSLSGAAASNYTLTQPSGLSANITPKPLTESGLTVANKVYDGTTAATISGTPTFGGIIGGDSVSISTGSVAAAFSDKNAGTNKSINLSGVTLSGTDAGNYTTNGIVGLTANITQLSSDSWVGGTSGNWSNAANWAGGVIPEGTGNVGTVTIPSGTTVTYDSGVPGTTTVSTISSSGTLDMAAGNLATTGALSTAGFQHTGGTLTVGGSFTVTQSYASTANSGQLVLNGGGQITQASGDLTLNSPVSWSANTLTLNAQNNINVNAVMNATGSASLALNPGASTGTVLMGMSPAGTVNTSTGNAYTGQINFSGSGTVSISGIQDTVINTLGAAGSTTGSDLQGMNGNLSGHYVLGANIDATATSGWNSGAGFAPIGGTFTGSFDGFGHTISSLTINRPSSSYFGLFGNTNGATVRNVGLAGGSVTGTSYGASLIGFMTNGTVSNSYNTASVNTSGGDIGGLVGTNGGLGTISNSYSTGAVTGVSVIGGLVGVNRNILNNDYATGNVTLISNPDAGGLVGYNGGTISNSYATGAVTASRTGIDSRAGGLSGVNAGTIKSSYATGNVTGDANRVGGLVGFNDQRSHIQNSYATGAASGASYVGGLVGFNYINVYGLTNDYSTGAVVGTSYVGAFMGTDQSHTTTANNFYLTGINGALTGIGNSSSSRSSGGTAVAGAADVAGTVYGMNSANMQNLANFTSATAANGSVNPNWDFSTTPVWGFKSGTNNGYPVLCAFYTCVLATKIYVDPVSGSSIYGSAPVFTYNLVDSGGAIYNLSNASVTGTAAYSGAPTATSSVGSYSFSYASGLSLSGSGASNYSLLPYATASTWAVNPKPLTVSGESAANKVYDGTTAATLTGGALAGVISGDVVSLTQAGSFASKNAGNGIAVNASDTISGTAASNYTLTQPTGITANITPASLTVAANNDSKFVTQADASGYNGVSYSGFVNGETSSVLGGALSISRSNGSVNSAGTYTGVLAPSGLTSGNYSITYANGNYTIVPAGELLVKTANASTSYGAAASLGAPTVEYLNGSNVLTTLTKTAGSGSTYTYSDGAGGTVTFTLGASGATSTSGNLVVGNYSIVGSSVAQTGSNFSGTPVYVGNLAVTQKGLAVGTNGVSKVYDGTTGLSGVSLGMTGQVSNDVVTVNGSGSFSQKDVGTNLSYSISNMTLSGADASDYYLTGGPALSGSNGTITQLSSVTWVGPTTGGSWSNPSNWAGGAIPDLSNVKNVVIPNGSTVTFDSTVAGPVNISQLSSGGLVMSGGTLDVSTSTNLQNYSQSGGTFGGTGSFTINGSFVQTGGTINTGGNVSITQSGGPLALGNVASGGILSVNSTGDVSQTTGTSLNVTGSTSVTSSSGSINLGNSTNSFGGTVSLSGNNVTLADNGTVNLGNVTSTGSTTVNSAGNVTQATGTSVNVTGSTLVTSSSGSINLGNSTNSFGGTVSLSGNNVTLADNGTVNLDNVTSTGSTTVNSTGDVNQATGTSLNVTGSTSVSSSGGNINLGNSTNSFGGTVILSGNNVTLADNGTLNLGNVTSTGNVTMNAVNDITQASGTSLNVAGNTSVTSSGGNVTLANSGNSFGGAVSMNAGSSQQSGGSAGQPGGNASLTSGGALNLGTVTTTGNLNSTSNGAMDLGTSTVGGNLVTTSNGGNITQTGLLSVQGTSDINAGTGGIDLPNTGNYFGGKVTTTGSPVTVKGSGPGLDQSSVAVRSSIAQTVSLINPATSQPLDLNPSTTISASPTPTQASDSSGSSGSGVTVNTTMSIAGTGILNIVNGGVKLPENVVGMNAGPSNVINMNQGQQQ